MEIQLKNQKYIDSNGDRYLKQLSAVKSGERVTIDFSQVEYLRPGAVIQLIVLSKMFFEKSGEKVVWSGIPKDRAFYLRRLQIEQVEFISVMMPPMLWAYTRRDNETVIPLEKITNRPQLGCATAQAMDHLREWFPEESDDFCRDAANIVMEIVNNSLDHSERCEGNSPLCYYTIQKYQPHYPIGSKCYKPRVIIAFGDAGIGMRESLNRRWNSAQTDMSAIELALKGYSCRSDGEGGMGFRRVSEVLKKNKGHLTIRSGGASIHCVYDEDEVRRNRRYHKERLLGTQTAFLF